MRNFLYVWIGAAIAIVVAQVFALSYMGQPLISASGIVKLWHGVVLSAENSQQISDWYTFSHIIHGFLFYLGLWLLFPRTSVAFRFLLAVGIEVSWEVFENTDFIINRYREQALAQGYTGDSIINSVCDTLAMIGGFLLAYRLPAWMTTCALIALEVFTLVMIRDSLALNIIQLIYPVEMVANWQSGR